MTATLLNKYKTLLVDINDIQSSPEDIIQRKEELVSLVDTHGGMEVCELFIKKSEPDLKLFLRRGLLDTLITACKTHNAQRIVLGNILKPRQIWELSELFRKEGGIQVWDRVDLILHIFSHHAHSAEAKLQIELAKIRHMGPRIFGMGDELSRQGGGGFTTRGIGETNTEIMKRHLRREELKIEEKLQKVKRTKCLHRQNRKRNKKETVALVGYTNAGKSQTMNTLSKKGVGVKDALFQTLDTRIGTMFLPTEMKEVFISDTIGFIADLPPTLIAAFQSTLSESIHADILLHVCDVSDPRRKEKIKIVDTILEQLGVSEKTQILVFNKTDIISLSKEEKQALCEEYKDRSPLFISAKQKEGIDQLRSMIATHLPKNPSFDTACCSQEGEVS